MGGPVDSIRRALLIDKYLSRWDFQVLSTAQYQFKVSATDPN